MSKPARLPLPTKRGLSTAEAAAYMGVSRDKFERRVRAGQYPKPFEGDMEVRGDRRVWDVADLDDYFDKRRGHAPQSGRKTTTADWEACLNGEGEGHGRAH